MRPAPRAKAAAEDDAKTFLADLIAETRGQTDPIIARVITEGWGPTSNRLVDRRDLPWTPDTAFRAAYGNSRRRVHGWAGHGGVDMIQLLHARLGTAGIDVPAKARLIPAAEAKGIMPVVDCSYILTQAPAANVYLKTMVHLGKVVIGP